MLLFAKILGLVECVAEFDADLARRTNDADLQATILQSQTKAAIDQFNAASGDVAAAITALADKKVLESVAESMGPMRLIGGGNITEILSGLVGTDVTNVLNNAWQPTKTKTD